MTTWPTYDDKKRWQNNNDGDNGGAVSSLSSFHFHCHRYLVVILSSLNHCHGTCDNVILSLTSSPSYLFHCVVIKILSSWSYHQRHPVIISCVCHLVIVISYGHCLLFFQVSSSFYFYSSVSFFFLLLPLLRLHRIRSFCIGTISFLRVSRKFADHSIRTVYSARNLL